MIWIIYSPGPQCEKVEFQVGAQSLITCAYEEVLAISDLSRQRSLDLKEEVLVFSGLKGQLSLGLGAEA